MKVYLLQMRGDTRPLPQLSPNCLYKDSHLFVGNNNWCDYLDPISHSPMAVPQRPPPPQLPLCALLPSLLKLWLSALGDAPLTPDVFSLSWDLLCLPQPSSASPAAAGGSSPSTQRRGSSCINIIQHTKAFMRGDRTLDDSCMWMSQSWSANRQQRAQ